MDSSSRPAWSELVCGSFGEVVGDGMRFGNHAKRPVQATKQIESENVPERKDTIPEADFLTFFVRSSVVADRYFVNNGIIELCHFRGDLDLNAKPFRYDDHVPDNIAAKGFVACFDIRHIQIRQDV